jgi:hypothetical protein
MLLKKQYLFLFTLQQECFSKVLEKSHVIIFLSYETNTVLKLFFD